MLAAPPAGASVTKVGSTEVGLQSRSMSLLDGVGAGPESFANPSGGTVLPSNKTYAIYWDPTYHYHNDWEEVVDGFFHNIGAASGSLASVFAVDTQYSDAANQRAAYASTFMGAYTDTDLYPTSGNCTDPHPLAGESYPKKESDAITCLTNAQVQSELERFIADHGLPKGIGTIFYLLTPPGVTVCLDGGGAATGHCSDFKGSITEIEKDEQEREEAEAKHELYVGSEAYKSYENSFCSYHADINPDSAMNGDSSTILYAMIPWIAGGYGDGHLGAADRTTGYECQDGGFDPSSKPIEEKEHIKVHTKKEEEEFQKEDTQEKREREEAEELELEKPHEQEPNQVACPSPDGYCDTGLADLIVSQIGAEQQNIVTDPLLNAWQDSSGKEATDECRDFFAPPLGGSVVAGPETFAGTLYNQTLAGGNYYLNDAFNLASLKLAYPGIPCLSGIRLEPKFTAPNPVNAGEIVGFDGMESDITLNEGTSYSGGTPERTYATYTWNFGDGSPTVSGYAPGGPSVNSPGVSPCEAPWLAPCAASTFHSYEYGGTYDVTLTVTDTGGNKASFTEAITVDGPAAPSPAVQGSGGGGSGGSTGSSGSTGGGSSSGTTGKPVANPVATQAVVSHSLSKTASKGLIVKYSVNQQVTGHFEVLLAASLAHRIGLHDPLATGLPKGTAPRVVIAKALLVTTKGGHSTIKIQLGKVTAERLRRLGKVSLMLRLVLRNSGGGLTTVLSTVSLAH
jgi:hypothetical protein